jgi:hypothetical protein
MCMYVGVHVCMCVCVTHACMHVCVRTYGCARGMCMYVCVSRQTHTYTWDDDDDDGYDTILVLQKLATMIRSKTRG